MCRKVFSFGGLLLLAGAVVLVTPGSGQAQHGGHGGGGHGGGHFGGGHFGGGYHGGNFGGYRGGFYHSGAHYGGYHYGYHNYYPHYGVYSYRHDHPYYGSYGYYYPYSYGSYGYDYPYYDTPYLSAGPTSTYDSGSYISTGNVTPYSAYGTPSTTPSADSYQAFYPSATVTTPSDSRAHVTVKVPADAQIWFDGTLTTSTGSVRRYDSPPLTPGSGYGYEVRARWNENGHEVTQTQHVSVTAGAQVQVDFPLAPKSVEKTPDTQKR
jgi:uncharacterized protein (TIGR03000 family)